MNAKRLVLLCALSAFAAHGWISEASAQSFPNKPVRIITGSPPGSGNDTAARKLAAGLSELWKQPVSVENRPGASQSLAAGAVARSEPDGYTLAHITSSILATALDPNSAVKLERDLVPIYWVANGPVIMVVNASLPVNNVKEFVAYARSKPGELNYGSAGVGSTGHLLGELFNDLAKVKLKHVPYQGGAKAGTAAAAGEIEMAFPAFSIMPLVTAGKLKALAVSSKDRSPAFPDIPTIDETVPGAAKSDWYGLFAPAGTPKDVLARIYKDVAKIEQTKDMKDTLAALGLDPQNVSPEEFAKSIREDLVQFVKLANMVGLKPDSK